MRIGINLLYLIHSIVGGTETYAAGLLFGLSKIDSQNEYIIFTNRNAAEWPIPDAPNFKKIVCPISGYNRIFRYGFEQFYLPRLLYRLKIDIVHSLGYVGPLFTTCTSVVTIPDLNYIDMAHTLSWSKRYILRFLSSNSAKRAKHVITISEFSKKRLADTLLLSSDKITVIHLSFNEKPHHGTQESWSKLVLHYRIKEPYLVAFTGGAIHKNIPRLIKVFSLLKSKYCHALVLIGRMPSNVDMSSILNDKYLAEKIVATGYVKEEHIKELLSHADLFILPSLYEGFGMPVLDAQQSEVAVACSTAGSLPEVAGKGAVFFNPESVDEMVKTIDECLSNTDLRQRLRQMGIENLKRFSWEKTAIETLNVYQKIVAKL
jgi:glycosyltransferase involved in cell wall biosynthesis